MMIEVKLDSGPVLASDELELEQHATHGEIEKKLSIMGANLLIESLKNIEEGSSKFVDQVHSKATYAKKIDKFITSRPKLILLILPELTIKESIWLLKSSKDCGSYPPPKNLKIS